MMRFVPFVVVAVSLVATSSAVAEEPAPSTQPVAVQLPNPAMLGQGTETAVTLLLEKKPGDAEPIVIWSDVKCGRYVASSAFYYPPVTAAALADVVNRTFGVKESMSLTSMKIWVVRDNFRVTVSTDQNAEAAVIRYIDPVTLDECVKAQAQGAAGQK